MKKRIMSLLLAFMVFCLMIPTNIVFAESYPVLSAKISDPQPAVGDEVTYTVYLDYTGKLTSMGIKVTSSDNLSCDSIVNKWNNGLTAMSNPESGKISYADFTGSGGADIAGNTELFVVTFTVNVEGPYKVELTVDDLCDQGAQIKNTALVTDAALSGTTEGYVDPDTADLATLNALKTQIEAIPDAMLTVSQADVPDKSAAETKIKNLLQLYLMGQTGVTFDVVVDPFVPAITGTKDDPDGTDGSYTAKVTLYKGTQSVDVTKSGTITATPYVHEHTFKYVAEKPATCTEDGVQAHYVCEECGAVFTGKDPDTETTSEALVIKAGHKFENSDAHHEAVEATCDKDGSIEYYVCDACGKKFATKDSTTELTDDDIIIKAHHTLGELVSGVEATCTTEGSQAYYECTECHKKFADAEGNQEITNIVIPALGHTLEKHDAVEPTCTETGTEAYWECDVCGALFSDEEGENGIEKPVEIAKVPHTLTPVAEKAATCTETGTEAYWECTVCGALFSDEEGKNGIEKPVEIAKVPHTLTATAAVEPTATTGGNIAYWTCSVCDKKFSDENCTTEVTDVTIPALGEQVEEIIKDKVQLTTEAVTQDQAVAQIVAQVKEALKNDDYNVTVNVSSFVAPVAGTAENPEGTAGQIVYMVTITNLVNAEDTTKTKEQTLAIAAKEYVAPTAPTYTITVNGAYVDKNTAKEGETVTVTAPYRYGYTFIGWKTSANLTLANRSPVSFKMPAGNVTIEPVYTYNPIYYPPVDYDPPVISKPVTKPEKVEDGWHGDQYYQDGEPVVGWLEVTHGTWYYFDRSGSMVTGWEKVNGTWYYMLDSGVMATGWVKVDGSWYFLKSSGAMATGWLWDNGHWYYLSGSGAMKTGWVLSGSKWYYLNASGAMVTGWVEWKGDWYYMNTPNGDMAVDTKTPDGYYVNSDGIWVK